MGRAATKGPEGEVCSASWGAAQLLPAFTVTLCPGQSPFRKISQGSWRLALPTVGQRSDLGGSSTFRGGKESGLRMISAVSMHVQVPKLKSVVWRLQGLTLDPLPPGGLVTPFLLWLVLQAGQTCGCNLGGRGRGAF